MDTYDSDNSELSGGAKQLPLRQRFRPRGRHRHGPLRRPVDATDGLWPASSGSECLSIRPYYSDQDGGTNPFYADEFSPSPLTTMAPGPTISYGNPVPLLSPTYSGFVRGDGISSLTKPAT